MCQQDLDSPVAASFTFGPYIGAHSGEHEAARLSPLRVTEFHPVQGPYLGSPDVRLLQLQQQLDPRTARENRTEIALGDWKRTAVGI